MNKAPKKSTPKTAVKTKPVAKPVSQTMAPVAAQSSSPPLIEMKNISIAFGGIKAVDHASIDLFPGEVV